MGPKKETQGALFDRPPKGGHGAWTLWLSPPESTSPQVTTKPSARRAANARAVDWMATTSKRPPTICAQYVVATKNQLDSVVYFSRGTLPPEKGKRALLGDLDLLNCKTGFVLNVRDSSKRHVTAYYMNLKPLLEPGPDFRLFCRTVSRTFLRILHSS